MPRPGLCRVGVLGDAQAATVGDAKLLSFWWFTHRGVKPEPPLTVYLDAGTSADGTVMSMKTGLPAEADPVGRIVVRNGPLGGSEPNRRPGGRALDVVLVILYKV